MLLPKNIERCQWVNRYCRIKALLNVAGIFQSYIVLKLNERYNILVAVVQSLFGLFIFYQEVKVNGGRP